MSKDDKAELTGRETSLPEGDFIVGDPEFVPALDAEALIELIDVAEDRLAVRSAR